MAQYYASPGTIRDRNTAVRGLTHTGFDAEGADLPAEYESVLGMLQYRNQLEDQILRIGSLASMDRLSEAQTANNLLSTATTESATYKAYMTNILSAGTDLSTLPAANYNTALLSLTAENISTRAMVENLQDFKEGIYHPLVAINPDGGEGRPSGERDQKKQAIETRLITVIENDSFYLFPAASGTPWAAKWDTDLVLKINKTLQFSIKKLLSWRAVYGQFV